MLIVKQVPSHITGEIIPNMQSLPQSAKDILMSRENPHIDYTNQMLIEPRKELKKDAIKKYNHKYK